MVDNERSLRARREALGLTQRELAEKVGTGFAQSQVSAAETRPATHSTAVARVSAVLDELEGIPAAEEAKAAWLKAEAERIAFQRSLWAALPDHPAVRALKAAMLDRCLDLMHNGFGEECDAIAEFLPEAEVEAMFAQWERECFPEPAPAAPVEA